MQRINPALFAGLCLFSAVAAREGCPDAKGWKGKYTNHSYGFAFTIPGGLEGYWNSARCVNGPDGCVCMSDHGRIIPLSQKDHEPERHIEAYAGFAADVDEPTVSLETEKRLDRVRARSRNSIDVRRRSAITLAGLEAERVIVRYYDEKLKVWLIEDFIEALRDDVEFSLYLRTKDTLYEHDRVVFEAVVNSFVLTHE